MNNGESTPGGPRRTAGHSRDSAALLGLRVPLGIGTMTWGESRLDARINSYVIPDAALRAIRKRAFDAGVTLIDTAEGYGGGTCEIRVRRAGFCRPGALVATKFLPTLWRWSENAVVRSVRRSNRRLGVSCCDLCFIHSPVHPRSLEVWIRGAAKAMRMDLLKSLGVSKFSAEQVRRAQRAAERLGTRIAANQILFNLLDYNAQPLQQTVRTCRELGIAVVGYGPLGQGLFELWVDERKSPSHSIFSCGRSAVRRSRAAARCNRKDRRTPWTNDVSGLHYLGNSQGHCTVGGNAVGCAACGQPRGDRVHARRT